MGLSFTLGVNGVPAVLSSKLVATKHGQSFRGKIVAGSDFQTGSSLTSEKTHEVSGGRPVRIAIGSVGKAASYGAAR